ncbi:hypothetical protein GCM10010521_36330 [Streptomyces rameus]|uniref:Uncharacterized protein n=1 Tax=Streptomyces rameus TaxID=68261 RepID=A0ABP6NEW8_9ACTN
MHDAGERPGRAVADRGRNAAGHGSGREYAGGRRRQPCGGLWGRGGAGSRPLEARSSPVEAGGAAVETA